MKLMPSVLFRRFLAVFAVLVTWAIWQAGGWHDDTGTSAPAVGQASGQPPSMPQANVAQEAKPGAPVPGPAVAPIPALGAPASVVSMISPATMAAPSGGQAPDPEPVRMLLAGAVQLAQRTDPVPATR